MANLTGSKPERARGQATLPLQEEAVSLWARLRGHVASNGDMLGIMASMEGAGWANVMWLATLHGATEDDLDEHLQAWKLEGSASNRMHLSKLAELGHRLAARIWAKEASHPGSFLL